MMIMLSELQKMLTGELYHTDNQQLIEMRNRSHKFMQEFNDFTLNQPEKIHILKQWLGKIGKNCTIEPNFRCDYGMNIELGDSFYANDDCVILDCAKVSIGNNVMLGPRVNLFTATHPIDAEIRNAGLEYAKPIVIEDNVWIGGNATILPGITIKENSIIAAGAVVTKDVPANSIVGGNPAKLIRKITSKDYDYWHSLLKH